LLDFGHRLQLNMRWLPTAGSHLVSLPLLFHCCEILMPPESRTCQIELPSPRQSRMMRQLPALPCPASSDTHCMRKPHCPEGSRNSAFVILSFRLVCHLISIRWRNWFELTSSIGCEDAHCAQAGLASNRDGFIVELW